MTTRSLALALAIPALGAAVAATTLALSGSPRTSSTSAVAAMPLPAWAAFDVRGLKSRLVRAGYQVRVDDSLDPVTESALADYLQPGSVTSLGPTLARALRGTVILGHQNPRAWNSRFGLDRPTKFVERPLTGPGGQLDENGNLRHT